jgi:hypothetical protein
MSEAEKKGFKLKGFIKKGEKVLAKEAPPELKSVAAQQEEFLDAKPSVLTTAVKQMFGKPKPAVEKSLMPIVPTATIEKKIEDAAIVKEEKKEKPVALKEVLEEDYDEALQKLGTLILEEEKGDPSLMQCLEKFFKEETLEKGQEYHCSNCNNDVRAKI